MIVDDDDDASDACQCAPRFANTYDHAHIVSYLVTICLVALFV